MPTAHSLAPIAFAAVLSALAQQTRDPVTFSGTVMNTATGRPIRNARVTLWYSPGEFQPVNGGTIQTDAAGAFQFPKLEPGDYRLMVAKNGFTAAEDHPDGYEISLTASTEKFIAGLTPLSSIRGRITDDAGDAVEGATIVALQSPIEDGHRRTQAVQAAITDDRGEYRIPLLPAGKYWIKASGNSSRRSYYGANAPPPAGRETFAPVYFGGSRQMAGAAPVALQPGVETRADFSVTLEPAHSIHGRIANLKPHNSADLQLSSGDEDLGLASTTIELATGQFEIHGVLDGTYRLRAFQRGDADQLQAAEQRLVIDGRDVDGIQLTLQPGASLKGKMRVEGPSDREMADFAIILESQDSLLSQSQKRMDRASSEIKDGAFEIADVLPGRYWVRLDSEFGMYIASARAGNTDLLAAPELVVTAGGSPELEIVQRADGGGVTGTVAAELAGSPELVIVLAPESCSRPVEATGMEEGNAFSFEGVAPGMYRLHAWKASAEVEYGSPRVACALARSGLPVEVKAGQETKVQLQKLSEEPE